MPIKQQSQKVVIRLPPKLVFEKGVHASLDRSLSVKKGGSPKHS
jgi:hypothetical protein